jgi:ferric iron reductase protein FhuF
VTAGSGAGLDLARFDEVCAVVRARVPYLGCELLEEASTRDGWIRLSTLGDDPELLVELVRSTGSARGAPSDQVAASLFVQALAFRAPSVAIAAWALGLPVVTLDPALVAVRLRRSRPAVLGVLTTELTRHDATTLASAVLDGLLAPVLSALRGQIRIGSRLLWSNVAASVAALMRATEDVGPVGDPAVRRRGHQLVAADARLAAQGEWETLQAGGATGWYWNRTACCLWYRTTESAGRRCEDCSLTDREERTARRLAQLTPAQPAQPAQPGRPAQPAQPGHPARPGQPAPHAQPEAGSA